MSDQTPATTPVRRKPGPCAIGCLIAIGAFLLLAVIGSMLPDDKPVQTQEKKHSAVSKHKTRASKTKEHKEQAPGVLMTGDLCYLSSGGKDPVPLAATEDLLNKFTDACVAKDYEGIALMEQQGEIIIVQPGTKARLLKNGIMRRQVRVMSGPHYPAAGWLAAEFVHKLPSND